jgi:hypothetical protein
VAAIQKGDERSPLEQVKNIENQQPHKNKNCVEKERKQDLVRVNCLPHLAGDLKKYCLHSVFLHTSSLKKDSRHKKIK